MSSLRLALRILAALSLFGSAVYWIVGGAHRGWSMDRVPVTQVDEITGLEYTRYEERFVPGIDVLLAGLGGGLGLGFVSLFVGRPRSNPTP